MSEFSNPTFSGCPWASEGLNPLNPGVCAMICIRKIGRTAATVAIILVALSSGLEAQQPSPALIPMPTAWDTSYVILLEENPAYKPVSEAATGAVMQSHFQYQLKLLADGRSVMGGPFVQAAGNGMVGMTLLRVPSEADAKAIVAGDPAVAAGIFRATLRTWTTPAKKQP